VCAIGDRLRCRHSNDDVTLNAAASSTINDTGKRKNVFERNITELPCMVETKDRQR
jgi:hypothetical protein